jgi:hypothetical protein
MRTPAARSSLPVFAHRPQLRPWLSALTCPIGRTLSSCLRLPLPLLCSASIPRLSLPALLVGTAVDVFKLLQTTWPRQAAEIPAAAHNPVWSFGTMKPSSTWAFKKLSSVTFGRWHRRQPRLPPSVSPPRDGRKSQSPYAISMHLRLAFVRCSWTRARLYQARPQPRCCYPSNQFSPVKTSPQFLLFVQVSQIPDPPVMS